jgi:adenylate cyclase
VMGPAVNRAARLESLTKTTGESILVSKVFSDQVNCPMRYLGEYAMKGISDPQMVYAPDQACE